MKTHNAKAFLRTVVLLAAAVSVSSILAQAQINEKQIILPFRAFPSFCPLLCVLGLLRLPH